MDGNPVEPVDEPDARVGPGVAHPLAPAMPGIPAFIDGGRVHHDTGKDGLRLYCVHHHGCEKFRSLKMDPFGQGPRAAEFYLGAWQACGADIDIEKHRAGPSRAEVEAYAAAHDGGGG